MQNISQLLIVLIHMRKFRIILRQWTMPRNQTKLLQSFPSVGIQDYFRLIVYLVKLFYQKELLIPFGAKDLAKDILPRLEECRVLKELSSIRFQIADAVDRVRSGSLPELTTRDKHTRECYVVLEDGADATEVEQAIVTMPNYFSDYDTTVTFISEEELQTRSCSDAAWWICHS